MQCKKGQKTYKTTVQAIFANLSLSFNIFLIILPLTVVLNMLYYVLLYNIKKKHLDLVIKLSSCILQN